MKTCVQVGEQAVFDLAVVNILGMPLMTVQLILEIQSGMQVNSSIGSWSCAGGLCTGVYPDVAPGDIKNFDVFVTANEPKKFPLTGQAIWMFSGEPSRYSLDVNQEIEAVEDAAQCLLPPTFVASPTPTPTVEPAATLEAVTQATPPPEPSGGGCFYSANTVDGTLVLILLLGPGMALGRRQRRRRGDQ